MLLSGTTTLKSKEYVGKSLGENVDRIRKGILFYSSSTQRNVSSQSELKGGIPQNLIDKLTSLLRIGPSQANDLVITYLLNDFTGSLKSVSAQFSGEKSIQSFVDDVVEFYVSERLYSLLVLKEILSNLDDSSHHPFQDIFKEFIGSTFTPTLLIDSIINQLIHLAESEDTNPSLSSDVWSIVASADRERCELNQALILAFHHFPVNIQDVIQLLSVYSRSSRTRMKKTADPHLEQIAISNAVLQSLIVVQCLSVGKLFSSIEGDRNDHALLSNPGELKQLDSLICNLSFSVRSNSIIFLGWIIVRSWEVEGVSAEESEQVVKRLGSLAVELGVFQVLKDFFSSNLFEKIFTETKVGRVLKQVTGDLLSIVFKMYRMEKIVGGQNEQLIQLLTEIETVDEVAQITFEEDSGLWTVLKDYLHIFPSDLSPFLKIATSIASTSYSQHMFQLMSDVEVMNEKLSSSSSLIEYAGSNGYYRSKVDRVIQPSGVYIRKGQVGRTIEYSSADSSVTIQWQEVSVSAWTILTNVHKKYYESLSVGSLQRVDDESLNDLVLMNNFSVAIVSAGGKFSLEVRELVKMALETFKLLARHPKIPRAYLSSATDLFCALSVSDSGKKDASNFWITIREFGLFPYFEGSFSNDELGTRSASVEGLNPSVIGSMISTIECIRGEYMMTMSFLNYISTIIDTIPVDDTLTSCVSFILSEIFPSYQLWHFKRSKQQQLIGYHCLMIAYKGLKTRSQSMSNLVLKILSSGRASDTLLNIIRAGIVTSGKVIKDIGVHEGLNSEEVVTIKLSLLVLEKVLTLSDSKVEQESRSDGKKGSVSSIEDAIFSSRGSVVRTLRDKTAVSSQNILLVLAHYVFQNFDPSLASQAASLMKVLANRHPLSMMSCLGSESESVKEHFLAKLESPTEDIDVKIAILDLLAECVIHQPGLIEVFVTQEDSDSDPNSVLETVLSILEEKKTGIVCCPPELHYTSLRFLSNFWVNSSLPVIERLKRSSNLWELVTFPFLEPNEATFILDFHPRIISCIERIIAREIFFSKRANKGQDPGFNCVLSFLPSRLSGLSLYLKDLATTEAIEDGNEESLVILAWKDLLVSMAHFDPVQLSPQVKVEIFTNLLESILKQLQLNGSQNVIFSLADTCLLIVKPWSESLLACPEQWINMNSSILYTVNESKDTININLLITIESYLIRSTLLLSSNTISTETVSFTDLIHPGSELLLHSLRLFGKLVAENRLNEPLIISLCSITMSFFNLLVTNTLNQSSGWIRSLKSNGLLGHLSVVLHHLLCNKLSIDLCQNIISIMISISHNAPTAELFVSTTNMEWMRTALKCDYTDISLSNTIIIQRNPWNNVYCLTIKLASTLLMNLKQFFVNEALTFVIENLDRITTCLRNVTISPSLELLKESKELLMFLSNLSKFKLLWMTSHLTSYEIIVGQVSVINHSVASFLVHRNLFLHLLESSSKPSFLSGGKKVGVMKQQQPNLDRSFTPSTMAKKDQARSELDPSVEMLLVQISAMTISFMTRIMPTLEDLLVIRKDPSKAHGVRLLLDRSFVEPNIDCENGASFGSLLAIFDYCSTSIRKVSCLFSKSENLTLW